MLGVYFQVCRMSELGGYTKRRRVSYQRIQYRCRWYQLLKELFSLRRRPAYNMFMVVAVFQVDRSLLLPLKAVGTFSLY